MNIGILGTGMVGRTLAGRLAALGHHVMVGSRDVGALLARTEPDARGREAFAAWRERHAGVDVGSFAQAAAHGEMIVNATHGAASLEALRAAGADHLDGKVLIDVANPLDFSSGMPPTLSVSNTDSLAEQIQRAFPGAKVVKTLNTVNMNVMVDPDQLAGGDHHMFVAGDEADARAEVTRILQDWFGWKNVIDLGDLSAARGLEMILPLWLRLSMTVQTPFVTIRVVR